MLITTVQTEIFFDYTFIDLHRQNVFVRPPEKLSSTSCQSDINYNNYVYFFCNEKCIELSECFSEI